MIEKAVSFAAAAHQGAVRKGTTIPYITHPMETAVIVAMMTGDEEIIAAAALHDVVEDTPVTAQELRREFGDRIAGLVLDETEDKTKTWKERKTRGIAHARTADRDAQMIVLGDKLSNMRSIARDYLMTGEEIWQRFREKRKEEQGWYYKGMLEALKPLENYPAYQEFLALYRKVFESADFTVDKPSD